MPNSIDVVLFSYNQERFIEKAIESILMQNTEGLQVRLLVADDASQDMTLDIIKETEKDYNGNIEFVYLDSDTNTNLGIASNYKRAIRNTTADYVAILEGDDYWTDPLRLQKHIAILDGNSEIQYTKNDYLVYNEKQHSYRREYYKADGYFFLQDVIRNNGLIGNLSSCVFRGDSLRQLPNNVFETQLGGGIDWNMGCALLKNGVGYYIREIMSVYRLNTGENVSVERVTAKEEIERYQIRANAALNLVGQEWQHEFDNLIRERKKAIKQHQQYLRYQRSANYLPPCLAKLIFIDMPKLKGVMRQLIPNKLYNIIRHR